MRKWNFALKSPSHQFSINRISHYILSSMPPPSSSTSRRQRLITQGLYRSTLFIYLLINRSPPTNSLQLMTHHLDRQFYTWKSQVNSRVVKCVRLYCGMWMHVAFKFIFERSAMCLLLWFANWPWNFYLKYSNHYKIIKLQILFLSPARLSGLCIVSLGYRDMPQTSQSHPSTWKYLRGLLLKPNTVYIKLRPINQSHNWLYITLIFIWSNNDHHFWSASELMSSVNVTCWWSNHMKICIFDSRLDGCICSISN